MWQFLKYQFLGIRIPYKTYSFSTETFDADPLTKSVRLERHFRGEFSMASVQSNKDMEDHNQVDVSHGALFVGIYDGFKGNNAASYIRRHIFRALLRRIELNDNQMTVAILREVVEEIENGFLEYATNTYEQNQHQVGIGLVSSGCLICIIWRGILYLANVGNSRAVLGSKERVGPFKRFRVEQLVRDHSCDNPDIQNELHAMHPDDKNICEFSEVRPITDYQVYPLHEYYSSKDPSWTIKGLIETSRCIGYAYLKKALFTVGTSFCIPTHERVVSLFTRPVLTSEPEVYSRVLKNTDRFIIFGSSGFWKLMSNEFAARIVNSSPRDDIAKRLAIFAIEKGAGKKGNKYSDIVRFPKGEEVSGDWGLKRRRTRPIYYDDMTVIVVFFDKRPSGVRPEINCYTCSDFADQLSEFTHFYNNNNNMNV
ncbi:probable protein phosphatase 2C 43 [Lathyrus oleraceus]|uniref:PPM-type phosphatase domain-containing protein n=1 Tax=Pisum sativum TaxID=3888 RepID=A0A9D4XV11_PEA|nr:probable protein phosphatase 2C 43 [Pisum sativum]KAI5426873.1 hypothetical protein KIW84_032343 [Pisum sativum]